MTSKFSNKFPIPEKFPQILHDYIKEVIRNQPKDILDFSFKYFYSLENKIPNYPTSLTQKNSTVNTEPNVNVGESNPDFNEQFDTIALKDNINTTRTNEALRKEDSKNINNNEEDDDENNEDNNELKEPELIVPISKEMEELINRREEEQEKKIEEEKSKKEEESKKSSSDEKSATVFSGISGSDSEKQGVKDFVSDLFFDNNQEGNEQSKKEKENTEEEEEDNNDNNN